MAQTILNADRIGGDAGTRCPLKLEIPPTASPGRRRLAVLLFSMAFAIGGTAAAAAVTYEYDELGRLTRVEDTGVSISTYEYDNVGNRTQVDVATAPGVPGSISVPTTSGTGGYTISWGTASGTVTAYKLYESTNSNFSGEAEIYGGTGTSKAVSGQGDGTYYYRVRACNGSLCGGYRTGSNGTVVTLPPGVPASITVPSSSTTGSFTISWGDAASGSVTEYRLYEATSSNFSGQVLVHQGAATSKALSGRTNGTYYYRVRACNGSGCSGYRTGGNSLVVTLPPGTPPSITVPSSSTTGSFTISWGTSSGDVTAYKLYESVNSNFSGQTLVHNGAATSKALSGRDNGTYYYRVRACNGSACSGYRTGSNSLTVTLPPGVPPSINVPASSGTGDYTVSWGSSTGNVTAYKLYQSTNSNFSGQTLVYSGTGTSKAISGQGEGTYYYRVRACNGSSCSSYRTGGNPTEVTLPPNPPADVDAPFQTGPNYTVSWTASSGATRYELWESYRSGAFNKVYDGPATLKSFFSKPDGSYVYKVKACNAGGCSDFSMPAFCSVCANPVLCQ